MSSLRRLFAGHRVRELRAQLGISQVAMAQRLGISISYLSQIENGDRPITPAVLTALARNFPDDWALVEPAEDETLLIEAIEAANDTSIADGLLPEDTVRRGVRQQPQLARRMVALHQELRRSQEQLRMLDDSVESGAGGAARLPWEEIRDWFHAESTTSTHSIAAPRSWPRRCPMAIPRAPSPGGWKAGSASASSPSATAIPSSAASMRSRASCASTSPSLRKPRYSRSHTSWSGSNLPMR